MTLKSWGVSASLYSQNAPDGICGEGLSENLAAGGLSENLDRHGAAAARGAHNSEVTGSKPVAGILIFLQKKFQPMKQTEFFTSDGTAF